MSICKFFLIAIGVLALTGPASATEKLLSFQQWKESQSLEANNRLARANNNLLLAKSGKTKSGVIEGLEKEVSRAQNSLELTKDFTIEDYLMAYLMTDKTSDNQAALRDAAKLLSPDEVAELMRIWLKSVKSQTGESAPPKTSWIRPARSWRVQ